MYGLHNWKQLIIFWHKIKSKPNPVSLVIQLQAFIKKNQQSKQKTSPQNITLQLIPQYTKMANIHYSNFKSKFLNFLIHNISAPSLQKYNSRNGAFHLKLIQKNLLDLCSSRNYLDLNATEQIVCTTEEKLNWKFQAFKTAIFSTAIRKQ